MPSQSSSPEIDSRAVATSCTSAAERYFAGRYPTSSSESVVPPRITFDGAPSPSHSLPARRKWRICQTPSISRCRPSSCRDSSFGKIKAVSNSVSSSACWSSSSGRRSRFPIMNVQQVARGLPAALQQMTDHAPHCGELPIPPYPLRQRVALSSHGSRGSRGRRARGGRRRRQPATQGDPEAPGNRHSPSFQAWARASGYRGVAAEPCATR